MGDVLMSFAFLVMAIGIGVPLISSGRLNVQLIKRNREARLHNDLEFVHRLTKVRIIDVVIDVMQIPLLPFAFLAKPSVTGWSAMGVVFVVSVVMRLQINRAKIRLLADRPTATS